MLIGSAAVLASLTIGVAPASAEPNGTDTRPDPFSDLSCQCQHSPGPSRQSDIERGIHSGLAGRVTPAKVG